MLSSSVKLINISENYSKFVIAPLPKGFGITLGNALRRTLLSSVPGASMFAIKINKIKHEFSAIEGITEDVTQIILNLKKLAIQIDETISNDEIANWKLETWPTLKINFIGAGVIKAKDIECPSGFSIHNKDLIIATSQSESTKFELEIFATRSVGFKTFLQNREGINSPGIIPTDSNFSPILNVSYEVEETKISYASSNEQLILVVSTNGTLSPKQAVAIASKNLISHFQLFANLLNNEELENISNISSTTKKTFSHITTPISDLNLPLGAYNALVRANIKSVNELTELTLKQAREIDGLGSKYFSEVKKALTVKGLSFKK